MSKKAQTTIPTAVIAAAVEFIQLRDREIHPEGELDNANRWHPDNRCDCCSNIRSPSRSWPWSLMVHCRTVEHVANQRDLDVSAVRKAAIKIRKVIEAQGLSTSTKAKLLIPQVQAALESAAATPAQAKENDHE